MSKAVRSAPPSISIVIPNGRAFPTPLVEQITPQLYKGDELIVVQNRSGGGKERWTGLRENEARPVTDTASSAPYDMAGNHQFLRLLSSESGAARARNVGWRAASNCWIMFLDDDVCIEKNFVARMRDKALSDGASVSTFRLRDYKVCDGGSIQRLISLDRGGDVRNTQSSPLILSEVWRYGAGAAMLVHRDLLYEIGGFKDRLGAGCKYGGAEDLEFLWHASRHTAVEYDGTVTVSHPVANQYAEVGRKFRQYGRAIACLSGTAKGISSLRTVFNYCFHLLVGTARATRGTDRISLHLRSLAFLAVEETIRVYLVSLITRRRTGALCDRCCLR